MTYKVELIYKNNINVYKNIKLTQNIGNTTIPSFVYNMLVYFHWKRIPKVPLNYNGDKTGHPLFDKIPIQFINQSVFYYISSLHLKYFISKQK